MTKIYLSFTNIPLAFHKLTNRGNIFYLITFKTCIIKIVKIFQKDYKKTIEIHALARCNSNDKKQSTYVEEQQEGIMLK